MEQLKQYKHFKRQSHLKGGERMKKEYRAPKAKKIEAPAALMLEK